MPLDKLEIKFYKLKNNEDIVAFQIQDLKGHYKIKRPLSVEIENDYETGRQILDAREWIPPIICESDEVYLPKNLVMFVLEVKESFKDEYVEAIDYLYKVEPKNIKKVIPDSSHKQEGTNVVQFVVKGTTTKPN